MKNALILGLDASSSATGFCLADGSTILDYGLITPNKTTLKPFQRVLCVRDTVSTLMAETLKFGTPLVLIEDISVRSGNIKAYKTLAWLQFALLDVCDKHKVGYELVQPSSWRSIYGMNAIDKRRLKREEQKTMAIKYCKDVLGIDASEDECEAILLALHRSKE